MCEDTGEKSLPALVTYHRKRIKGPSYLEISDSSVLRSLDMIISTFLFGHFDASMLTVRSVTFLIMEKKKRDR
jgi:hypothetical protein